MRSSGSLHLSRVRLRPDVPALAPHRQGPHRSSEGNESRSRHGPCTDAGETRSEPFPNISRKPPHGPEPHPLIQADRLLIRCGHRETGLAATVLGQRRQGPPQHLITGPGPPLLRRYADLGDMPGVVRNQARQRNAHQLPGRIQCHIGRRSKEASAPWILHDVQQEPLRSRYRPILVVDSGIHVALIGRSQSTVPPHPAAGQSMVRIDESG